MGPNRLVDYFPTGVRLAPILDPQHRVPYALRALTGAEQGCRLLGNAKNMHQAQWEEEDVRKELLCHIKIFGASEGWERFKFYCDGHEGCATQRKHMNS